MEKSSCIVLWKATTAQRRGKASWKAILVERHGKCRHGMRHGKALRKAILVQRHGIVVTE